MHWTPFVTIAADLPPSCFLPASGHNFCKDQPPLAPFVVWLLKKKITQTMAGAVLKTKMKKHLIAGSKVSRNCFSNIPTGSSLRRQKSSVLINSTNTRTLRKGFCGFIWETFYFCELHFCFFNLHLLSLTVKHIALETAAPVSWQVHLWNKSALFHSSLVIIVNPALLFKSLSKTKDTSGKLLNKL